MWRPGKRHLPASLQKCVRPLLRDAAALRGLPATARALRRADARPPAALQWTHAPVAAVA